MPGICGWDGREPSNNPLSKEAPWFIWTFSCWLSQLSPHSKKTQVLIHEVWAFPLQRFKKSTFQKKTTKQQRHLVPIFHLQGPSHWFYFARNVSLASKLGMSFLVPPDIPSSLDGKPTPDQERRVGRSSLACSATRSGKFLPCSERVTQQPNQQREWNVMGLANLASSENWAALAQPEWYITRVRSRKCRLGNKGRPHQGPQCSNHKFTLVCKHLISFLDLQELQSI